MGTKLKKTVYGLCVVTAAMHMFNKVVFNYATRRKILESVNGKYFKTRFGNMFYTVCGEGKPVLLIHDLSPFSSGYEWSRMVNRLSSEYKVYVVDLLGCGRSEKPEISYTSYMYVNALKEFIDSVICEKVDIVSTGKAFNFVAMINSSSENTIGKTVVISPEPIINASFGKLSDKGYLFNKIKKCPVVGTFIYNFYMSKNLIEEKFEEDFFYDKKLISARAINACYESAHLSGAACRFLFASLESNYLYTDVDKSVTDYGASECMIVMGEYYKSLDEIKKQYLTLNSEISCKILLEANGLPQLEKPVELSEIIISFFG